VVAFVALDPRFARRDAAGRAAVRFTAQDATAVADAMTARLGDPDVQLGRFAHNQLQFRPLASADDAAREGRGHPDFSTVIRRTLQDDAHAFVRLELDGQISTMAGHPDPTIEANYDVVVTIVRAVNRPQGLRVQRDGEVIGDVTLVMPNWLTTGGSHHGASGSGGGPGAPPIAITTTELPGLAAIAEGSPLGWPFHIRFGRNGNDANEQAVEGSNRGEGTIVLVLDTAPTRAAIEQSPIANPLFQSLRQRLGDLTISVRELGDLPTVPVEPSGGGDPYRMTDHGLFVAGLIHDIAPRAEIRLWRVLNDFGGGDLCTLVQALAEALETAQDERKPVLINLSLVINMPVETLNALWASPNFNFQQRFDATLDVALGEIRATDCVAVAAAGNGSGGEGPAQEPRYPARFDTVIAVAAANRGGQPALFADRGEVQSGTTPNGVATFGGDADRSGGGNPAIRPTVHLASGTPIRDAPIGIMISATVPQDNGQANETGWAYWAGSSFATPIVTGLTACLVSAGAPMNAIVNTILARAPELGPQAELGVSGIPVRQLVP
jgi:hypothetical protein